MCTEIHPHFLAINMSSKNSCIIFLVLSFRAICVAITMSSHWCTFRVLSNRRRYGEGQNAEDRSVITAVHRILLGADIKMSQIHEAGITGYGYNTKHSLQKLKDGIPRADSGRRPEWTFGQIFKLQKHLEKYSGDVIRLLYHMVKQWQLCMCCLMISLLGTLHGYWHQTTYNVYSSMCGWLTVLSTLPIRSIYDAEWSCKADMGVFETEMEDIGSVLTSSEKTRESCTRRRETNSKCRLTQS